MEIHTLDTVGLVEAIRQKKLGAVELLTHIQKRVEMHNRSINAVVQTDFEAAMAAAKSADSANTPIGPLHGLPMTLKDCWEVVGFNTTAGAEPLKTYRPRRNAFAVQKLLDAGAIVYGKTNTPAYAQDVQTYNKLFGVTNNPWNVDHTSGGSSGGSAAAVAAGFTTLEVGSDIGGSIRTPAHYCGVYGHKPTHNIISMHGHIPGPPNTRAVPDLAVAGPITRSARDLQLALSLLAGPDPLHAPGWRLDLPPARHQSLTDFRVAVWLDDDTCPIDAEMGAQFDALIASLQRAGATVTEAKPATMPKILSIYYTLLAAVTGAGLSKSQYNFYTTVKEDVQPYLEKYALPATFGAHVKGRTATHRAWLGANEQRAKLQYQCRDFFTTYDVLLTPVTPCPAPLHNNHTGNMEKRRILINGEDRPYVDQLPWIALATTAGLPATSAPIGRTSAGLPINIQIIGSYLEDYTTIQFAQLLADVRGSATLPTL